MKTFGLIPSQTLISLAQDDADNWLDVPEGQTVVPLVKTDAPTITSAQKAEPHLEWFADRVERQWIIVDRPSAELIAEAKTAKRAAMAAAFDALPIETQAALYNTRITAEQAMDRDRFDIARAIVDAQAVPPELEATKAAILAHFD